MSRYAEGTAVTEQESRDAVSALLFESGAQDVEVGLNARADGVTKFRLRGRYVRIYLRLPSSRERARRWRVLLLTLKAKLAAVEAGISTFDDEFLAWIALPDGRSVGAASRAMLEERCSPRS